MTTHQTRATIHETECIVVCIVSTLVVAVRGPVASRRPSLGRDAVSTVTTASSFPPTIDDCEKTFLAEGAQCAAVTTEPIAPVCPTWPIPARRLDLFLVPHPIPSFLDPYPIPSFLDPYPIPSFLDPYPIPSFLDPHPIPSFLVLYLYPLFLDPHPAIR
jgi:hypothetical protein